MNVMPTAYVVIEPTLRRV